jgi:hypothetical protein
MRNQQEHLVQILKLILKEISSLSESDLQSMGINEMTENLRMRSIDLYESFGDIQITLESMYYLQIDSQLRSNANHFWQEQMKVFKDKLAPIASDFLNICKTKIQKNLPEIEKQLNILIQ